MTRSVKMILECMERQVPVRLPGTSLTGISDLPAGRDYEIAGFDSHVAHEEVVKPDSFTEGVAPNLMIWNGQRHMPVLTFK